MIEPLAVSADVSVNSEITQNVGATESISAVADISDHYNPSVREVNIPKLANGSCGFDLSRSKWDPYPWVSGIDKDSTAQLTGLKVGDCILEVNGEDILGLRIAEVASLVKTKPENVTLLLWTTGMDPTCSAESLCCGPMPLNLDRLSSCVQSILAALECPVCLDTIPPPVIQCVNGHLVCVKCRARAERCPICRQRYNSGRSLIAEQVYRSIMDSFKLHDEDGKLKERLFGVQCRKTSPTSESMKAAPQSHTHKFLAKIMGKASSMDSLSTGKINGTTRDDIKTAKHLSLSVNEIFRPNNSSAPSSRSTSPHRLTPDLGSQTFLGTRRPKSQNVSMESLNGEEAMLRLEIPLSSRDIGQHYGCPCGEFCAEKLPSSALAAHVSQSHRTPIITFGVASANVALPPKPPIDSAVLVLRLDDTQFWIQLKFDGDAYFVAALMQSGIVETGRFYLEVNVANVAIEKLWSKEIVSRCAVVSMEQKAWKDVWLKKDGIFITIDSIKSTFGESANILLKATIKHM